MTKKEQTEIEEQLLGIYCGILYNRRELAIGERVAFTYNFSDPAYAELLTRYPIADVAGRGGDFERALRLCRWLVLNLAHKGDFSFTAEGGTMPENARAFLDYSFGDPAHGINCVAKAKILVECCLALGIYARRVGMYPESPYDSDNHFVCEIFDRAHRKWIMLDPTTGGYLSDGKNPLSVLEARGLFADMVPVSVVLSRQSTKNFEALAKRNRNLNSYYAKNLCYLGIVAEGDDTRDSEEFFLIPKGFDVAGRVRRNRSWLLAQMGERECPQETYERLRERANTFEPRIGSAMMWDPPVS